MKENSFYFQHDNTSSNDEKILDLRSELGYEGYGIYWSLLELLHQNEGKLNLHSKRLAFAMQVNEQMLIKIINDFDLFIVNDTYFYSERLLNQIEYRAEIIEKRREAGAKGGKSKANAKQMLSKTEPKERKGEESKGDFNTKERFLNQISWDETICMKKKISKPVFDKLKEDFVIDQELKDGFDKPIKEVNSHFINWMNGKLKDVKPKKEDIKKPRRVDYQCADPPADVARYKREMIIYNERITNG